MNYNYTFNDIAWYTVVTLRDSCLNNHLNSLKSYYPNLHTYIIDNNGEQFNLNPITSKYPLNTVLSNNKTIKPLTINQIEYSKILFEKHKILCFSADDILILEHGFIEKALEKINLGAHIVSFSTDLDPVAYMYTEEFFNTVGFNPNLKGKESTDRDLIKRTKQYYGKLDFIGEFWREDNNHSWYSKYVLNPAVGILGKTDVNMDLEKLGIPSGVYSNNNII